MVRDAGLGLAVAMRTARIIAVSFAALSLSGAAPGEEREMLEAFEKALGAMSGIAGVLCVFALVWAGFAAMADGAEERGGRARKAVVLAVGRSRPGADRAGNRCADPGRSRSDTARVESR